MEKYREERIIETESQCVVFASSKMEKVFLIVICNMDIVCKILHRFVLHLILFIFLFLFYLFLNFISRNTDAFSICSKSDCTKQKTCSFDERFSCCCITGVPIIVKVFPDPVWPQAKTQALQPSKALSITSVPRSQKTQIENQQLNQRLFLSKGASDRFNEKNEPYRLSSKLPTYHNVFNPLAQQSYNACFASMLMASN